METEQLEQLPASALKPQSDLIAAWRRALIKVSARVAVGELLARAAMKTHPDRDKPEAAFIALIKDADAEMPAELQNLLSEWDKAVGDMLEWLEKSRTDTRE